LKNQASTNPKFVASTTAPVPLKSRGNYFSGSTYWTVNNSVEPFYLNHSFAIIAWVKCPYASRDMSVFSKNKVNPSGTNTENLLNFSITGATGSSRVNLVVADGSTSLYSISSDTFFPSNTWT
jgi:hypothetical protein